MDVVRFNVGLIIIFGFTIILSSCKSGSNAVDVGDPDLLTTVDLQVGQSIRLSDVDLLITFDGMVSDNRSIGEDGTVVGNACISIRIRPFFSPNVLYSLNTAYDPQGVAWEQYRILLVALNPVPQTGIAFSSNAYVATFEISQVGIL